MGKKKKSPNMKGVSERLSFLSFIFKVYVDCSRRFHFGISHIYTLYFNQIKRIYHLLLITLLFYYSTAYSAFRYSNFIQIHCGSILFTLSFFFPPLPPHNLLRQTYYYNLYFSQIICALCVHLFYMKENMKMCPFEPGLLSLT
jgi:hypothetical protein